VALRAAAPWQKLRRREAASSKARVLVRKNDFRIRRFVQRLESTTIFVVDASGSTAAQRLAEAKGAVENLLAEAYVTRARVALIVFRDKAAELLLPPTRSLSRRSGPWRTCPVAAQRRWPPRSMWRRFWARLNAPRAHTADRVPHRRPRQCRSRWRARPATRRTGCA
jgi:hypothetical protein